MLQPPHAYTALLGRCVRLSQASIQFPLLTSFTPPNTSQLSRMLADSGGMLRASEKKIGQTSAGWNVSCCEADRLCRACRCRKRRQPQLLVCGQGRQKGGGRSAAQDGGKCAPSRAARASCCLLSLQANKHVARRGSLQSAPTTGIMAPIFSLNPSTTATSVGVSAGVQL